MTVEATIPDDKAATAYPVMSGNAADGRPGTDALTDWPEIAERARER
jgi:hypothetical protein